MPLTTADFDLILIRQSRKKLAYAGLDSVTADGTNTALARGKVEGYRSLGLTPASPMNLVDADLAGVPDSSIPQLLAVANLCVLEDVLGNRAAPDQMADTDNQQWHGKFYDSLEATVARERKQCERQYGYGLAPLTPGIFDLGFAETIDLATEIPD